MAYISSHLALDQGVKQDDDHSDQPAQGGDGKQNQAQPDACAVSRRLLRNHARLSLL